MRSNDSNEIIELNVGGHAYTTSKTTILSYPDSMLSRLVSGMVPTATDSKQRVFIDRDGPMFRHILNFLRDKRLNLPENFDEYAQLRQEADFYRIEPIINYLDYFFNSKLNNFKSISSSMTSLVNNNNNNPIETQTANSNNGKSFYFTVISKLYQGSLESYVGCIRILSTFISLDANSRKFMSCLINQFFENSTAINTSSTTTTLLPASNGQTNKAGYSISSFLCECKFMHEEKIICCKPCGLYAGADQNQVNLCQSVVRLAKRFGIATGYWEDMFYLTLESSMPNREQLCSHLAEKHNAKLLSTCICDRRTNYDENNTSCSLVERWLINPTGSDTNVVNK